MAYSMFTGELYVDIVTQYKTISARLKKKLLRKPNYPDIIQQFTNLAYRCENEEIHNYAGLSWMAVAKVEAILRKETKKRDTYHETTALIRASKQFILAEDKDRLMLCVSTNSENLHAGIDCIDRACEKLDDELQVIGLIQHAAKTLESYNLRNEADIYYRKVIDRAKHYRNIKESALFSLGSLRINAGDYENALHVYHELYNHTKNLEAFGVNRDTFERIEVTRVLLLLLLKPPPKRHAPTILEKYTWLSDQSKTEVPWMNPDVYMNLQALVMACQLVDKGALKQAEIDICPHISDEQKYILAGLVRDIVTNK